MKIVPNKDRLIHLRLTEKQFNYLVDRSNEIGVTVSAVVRGFIDYFINSDERSNCLDNKSANK